MIMLKEITIKNFKSIKDEIFFTMEADSDRVGEYKNHYVKTNDNDILRTSSMYGPNGGGKSNILSAILMLKNIVIDGGYNVTIPKEISNVFSDDNIITETVFFINEKYEIGYSIKYNQQVVGKNAMYGIINHPFLIHFYIFEEEIVYREKNKNEFKTLLTRNEKGKLISNDLKSYGVNLDINISQSISAINHLFTSYANTKEKLSIGLDVIKELWNEINSITMIDKPKLLDDYLLNIIRNNKDTLIKIMNNMDIKIDDIIIYENHVILYPIYFVRNININGNLMTKELSLIEESSGTTKIFWMVVEFISSINNNTIFICDDMNSYLHPKLFREIINLFNSDFNKKSQLIFNSHDILNMDNSLFRRDEIWFVFRDENYSTKIIPLSNIVNYKGEQVRKDAKYYKQYLEGKYGADPFIKKGFGWNEL